MELPNEHNPKVADVVLYDKLRMSDTQIKSAELICVLLISACAAVGFARQTDGDRSRQPSVISDCTEISPTMKRLACYDALAHRSADAGPAKGATAPPVHGHSQF